MVMPKILICTVGGSPNPIIKAIKENESDFVYFICSGGENDNSRSDKTITEKTTHTQMIDCPSCHKKSTKSIPNEPITVLAGLTSDKFAIHSVTNPDDMAQLYEVCIAIESDISKRYPAPASPKIIANYTGGTKTMGAALVLFATLVESKWALQINVGTRGNLQQITSGDIPMHQSIVRFRIREVLSKAQILADRYDYEGAYSILKSWLKDCEELRFDEKAKLVQQAHQYEMKAYWERFDYEKALQSAGQYSADFKAEIKTLKKLQAIRSLFSDPNAKWPTKGMNGNELMVDIVENARRCVVRERYDDAVGRLYRATELLAQIKLLRDYDIRTENVLLTCKHILPPSQKWLKSRKSSDGSVKIALMDNYQLLSEMADPLGLFWAGKESKAVLNNCLDARNRSLFAHGLNPVTTERWQSMGKKWFEWLDDAMKTAFS